MQTYDTAKFTVAHFDLYRLKSVEELDELGWDEIRADGVTLVEWPERAGERLTDEALTLHFVMDHNGHRTCTLSGQGAWSQRLKEIVT